MIKAYIIMPDGKMVTGTIQNMDDIQYVGDLHMLALIDRDHGSTAYVSPENVVIFQDFREGE